MNLKLEYKDLAERERLIAEHSTLFIIEEQNITEGNFLIFSETPMEPPRVYVSVPLEELEALEQGASLLKAQNNALSERADFIEDIIAEMAMMVYS